MPDSSQKFIGRNRPPRVQIEYVGFLKRFAVGPYDVADHLGVSACQDAHDVSKRRIRFDLERDLFFPRHEPRQPEEFDVHLHTHTPSVGKPGFQVLERCF